MDELTQAFFETLQRTQYLPRERMLLYQRGLIEQLVRHARAHVPFYRDSGRLDVLFTADDRIDWDRWSEVPVLTRAEAGANAERLYAETVPPHCGAIVSGMTSGSTGRPLAYRVPMILAAAGSAVLERALVWADMPATLSFAWFASPIERPATGAEIAGQIYRSKLRGGDRVLHRLDTRASLAQQADWLAGVRPDVVMSYPGLLAQLAQALPSSLADHPFRLAICLGEVATPELRATIEAGFRCPTLDLYSGSEFGTVAVEDRRVGRLFLCEETVFVEFADGANDLTELIFTPVYNFAMPLIRYATGDFAVVDNGPAADRRTLRRLTRIVGRARNLFILPSGRRWWPQISSSKELRPFLDYDQIQFVQTRRDRIELRYVTRAETPVRDAAELAAVLRGATPEPVEVVLKRVAEIPRHASGKYEDYVCALEAG